MGATEPAGVAFHHLDGVEAGGGGPADVLLEDDVLRGVLGEEVVIGLAVELGELVGMVMVARGHSERFQFCGDFVEGIGKGLPFVGFSEVAITGDDEELAADGLVELDGGFEGVAAESVGADVSGGYAESEIVEALFKFFGFAVVVVVAGELDAIEAHFGDLGEGGIEVFAAIAAHRIELEGDGQLFTGGVESVQAG